MHSSTRCDWFFSFTNHFLTSFSRMSSFWFVFCSFVYSFFVKYEVVHPLYFHCFCTRQPRIFLKLHEPHSYIRKTVSIVVFIIFKRRELFSSALLYTVFVVFLSLLLFLSPLRSSLSFHFYVHPLPMRQNIFIIVIAALCSGINAKEFQSQLMIFMVIYGALFVRLPRTNLFLFLHFFIDYRQHML